jgi:hypothetical protein
MAATLLILLLSAGWPAGARAQEVAAANLSSIEVRLPTQSVFAERVKIRDWPSLVSREQMTLLPATGATFHQAARFPQTRLQNRPRHYNTAQRIAASVGMGFAGFFAGGYLGAKLEPDCRCDDPGLQGFIIGAPIGAAAGAIFGAWLTR